MDCPERVTAVPSIPEGPLVEILSRVPAKSLCRFKCVSKAWRDLIADPFLRKKLPHTLEGFLCSEYEIRGCSSDACSCQGDGSDEGDCSEGGDDEDCGEDGDERVSNDEIPFHVHRCFIDLLGRPTRLVDPCFSFLTKMPGIECIRLLHYCNGLFLFQNVGDSGESLNFMVCNPATEQWVSVPSSGLDSFDFTYLYFDRATTSHFRVVQFCVDSSVITYSSETREWSQSKSDWGGFDLEPESVSAYVNGMLYVHLDRGLDNIVAIDVEGNNQNDISTPVRDGEEDFWPICDYLGHSQGRLHYIYHLDEDYDDFCCEHYSNADASGVDATGVRSYGLRIWALENYDTDQWLLKHTVSFLELFGKMNWRDCEYEVVGMHPDCNTVFLLQGMNRKLISYNMDSKEVHDLCTLGDSYRCIAPYVPCFSELPVFEDKD